MNFIKLHHNIGALGAEKYKPVLVNLDHVRKISTEGSTTQGRTPDTKLTFDDQLAIMVKESFDYIEAHMDNKLERYYSAPEPKDA